MGEANAPVRGLIFDMDGLMLDTERPAIPAWVDAGRLHGWAIDEQIIWKTVGVDEKSTQAILMEKYGPGFPYGPIRADMVRIMEARIAKEGIPHRPGLLVLLDHLEKLGIPKAVATSSDRSVAERKMQLAGIRDRFSILACGDEVRQGKPAPDIFLLAAERLGIPPAFCVGFEDSTAGLRSLHAAGIRSVFIKDCVEPPQEVLNTVWLRCADLAEAAGVFK
jgi:HAD superfamily hydrolase (TIGR01509 family)